MSGNRQASDLTARIQARTLYANVIATRKLIEQGCNTRATIQSGSAADNAQSLLPTLALGARLTTAAERDAILAPVCAPVVCVLSGDTLIIIQFTIVGATTWECPCSVTSIEYLVVGGGGGGGSGYDTAGAGGGGAGLVVAGTLTVIPNTTYAVEVGSGGAGGTMVYPTEANGSDGGISRFELIYAAGGTGGFRSRLQTGGSGLGGSIAADPLGGGAGRGGGSNTGGGGGGGNDSEGGNGSGATPGSGGTGVSMSISGSVVTYGAGGNGARGNTITTGADATANSGNGGGGGGYTSGGGSPGGAGGSGIVIIKYYQ